MRTYQLENLKRDSGILHITLVPNKPSDRLNFEPGQYATIGFRGKNGKLSPMRCFSITSSADSDNLEFAARLDGDFTHALADLKIGDTVYVQGPFGEFIIDRRYARNVVMIAGGIGITPFMSMLRTAANTGFPTPITLLYSCRIGDGIPFDDELREMEKSNPKLRVAIFATDQTNPPEIPRMHSGRMTERHIDQVVNNEYRGSTYFICGPKGFTESTESMLLAKGVSEDRIITESFTQASKIAFHGINLRTATYAFSTAVLIAGILAIASIDLIRYIPRHNVSASSPSQSTQTVNSSTTNTTTPSNTSTNTSYGTSNTNSTNNSSSTSSQNTTYQQPVTSVS